MRKETKACKVKIENCQNQNHQNWNWNFLSVRNVEGQKGEKFSKFFFWFSCSEWLNSQKKAKHFFFENFDFFSKSEECGGLCLFFPLEREPKLFLTLRRFYLQHFSKKLRAVFSKSPHFWPLFAQTKGGQNIFSKNRACHFSMVP